MSRTLGGSLALVNIIATKSKAPTAGLELTFDELRIIQNALNEVCNDVGLEGEFKTRMASSLEAARANPSPFT